MMCMVKADAYGHGLVPVAKAAVQAGTYALGVAMVEEGSALRKAGITVPILCVGACFLGSLAQAVCNDITLTIYDTAFLEELDTAAARQGKTAQVHIKIDSGMARLGVQSEQELHAICDCLKNCTNIEVTGAFTHFATSDCTDKTFTLEQAAFFDAMLCILKQRGYTGILRHASCSGGILDCPNLNYDMVRPGIALYGYYPSKEVARQVHLQPVLRLESRLTQIKVIKSGCSVGYGRSYIAKQDITVGVVPIGYGDGYRRGNSNRGFCVVCGQRVPIVGRVCMDQLMVDITGIAGATEGALVTLIGTQDGAHIWADEIADICDTISYEILLNLSGRVPKVYCGG